MPHKQRCPHFILGKIGTCGGTVRTDEHGIECGKPFPADVPVLVHAYAGIETVDARHVSVLRHVENHGPRAANALFRLRGDFHRSACPRHESHLFEREPGAGQTNNVFHIRSTGLRPGFARAA